MRWDIFCRVIDNFGDIGVCWRLAAQLAAGGDAVRLVADDLSALRWMAPGAARGAQGGEGAVETLAWPGPAEEVASADVVIEAFGCELPAAQVQAMRARQALRSESPAAVPTPAATMAPATLTKPLATSAPAPIWINLEYLSAEAYVERSHGLPSPRADGLRKWFFYPGFTLRTGGLLREPGLEAARGAFEHDAWLAAQGCTRQPHERVVSLFCYANAALPALLAALAEEPTLLLLTPGPAQQQVPPSLALGPYLRTHRLPWLSQHDYDRLLWASDLNAVRGEDSLVRALWAGAPFLWQAYPQDDGAHAAKVEALLAQLALPAAAEGEVGAAHALRAWNGLAPWRGLPPLGAWRTSVHASRAGLLAQPDLATQLRSFVDARRC